MFNDTYSKLIGVVCMVMVTYIGIMTFVYDGEVAICDDNMKCEYLFK